MAGVIRRLHRRPGPSPAAPIAVPVQQPPGQHGNDAARTRDTRRSRTLTVAGAGERARADDATARNQPLVRSITCWTLSRYILWCVENESRRAQFLHPAVHLVRQAFWKWKGDGRGRHSGSVLVAHAAVYISRRPPGCVLDCRPHAGPEQEGARGGLQRLVDDGRRRAKLFGAILAVSVAKVCTRV